MARASEQKDILLPMSTFFRGYQMLRHGSLQKSMTSTLSSAEIFFRVVVRKGKMGAFSPISFKQRALSNRPERDFHEVNENR